MDDLIPRAPLPQGPYTSLITLTSTSYLTPTIHQAGPSSTSSSSNNNNNDPSDPNANNDPNHPHGSAWEHIPGGAKAAILFFTVVGSLILLTVAIWFCCGCCGLRQRRQVRRRKAREARDPNPRHLELEDFRAQEAARRRRSRGERGERPVPLHGESGREGVGRGGGAGVGYAAATAAGVGVGLRSGGIDHDHDNDHDAPPQYDEIAPPEHLRLEGGMSGSQTPRRDMEAHQSQAVEEEEGAAGVISDGKMPLSEMAFEDVVLDPHHTTVNGGEAASSSSRAFGERHFAGVGNTTGHTNS